MSNGDYPEPRIINVPTPKKSSIIEAETDVTAHEVKQLLEEALNLRETSLFANDDSVSIVFVRQGNPRPPNPPLTSS
jgi:hypothetical protein